MDVPGALVDTIPVVESEDNTEGLAIVDAWLEEIFNEVYERQPKILCGVRTFVIRCIFFTTLTSCLLGYDIGIWGAAKLKIQKRFDLSDLQIAILVGSLNIIAAFGGLLCGQLSERYGRRRTIGAACLLFIVGSFFKCAAMSYASLMVGRVLTGFGVGIGMAIAPLYGAELSPKKIRGGLLTLTEISINIGILLGYVLGWAFSGLDDDVSWRAMLGMGAFPPLIILVALIWMPESPRWLVKRNREPDAARVLAQASDRNEAQEAIEDLRILKKETMNTSASWKMLFTLLMGDYSPARKLVLAGIGVAIMQQASGIEAQVYYTPEILGSAGLESESEKLRGQMLVGLVKVAFIFIPLLTLDSHRQWLGRRKLLMVSAAGMAFAQILLAINFMPGKSSVGLALTGQCFFMAFFSLGYGPITWVYTAEIFPLQFRGKAMGAATFMNRITSGIIAMSFSSLTKGITTTGTFFLFAALALVSWLYAWLYVPETKGKSLEEIEQTLGKRGETRKTSAHNAYIEQENPKFALADASLDMSET